MNDFNVRNIFSMCSSAVSTQVGFRQKPRFRYRNSTKLEFRAIEVAGIYSSGVC